MAPFVSFKWFALRSAPLNDWDPIIYVVIIFNFNCPTWLFLFDGLIIIVPVESQGGSKRHEFSYFTRIAETSSI